MTPAAAGSSDAERESIEIDLLLEAVYRRYGFEAEPSVWMSREI